MQGIDRRQFLVRTGLALGAAALARGLPDTVAADPAVRFDDWKTVKAQFPLSPELIHLAGFFLASHPTPVRRAIERHRAGLDADPLGYWLDHEEKQEASVLRAAARYLGAEPTEIALTDSTTMGLGLLYGGLDLRPRQEILTTTHDHYSTDMSLRLRAERTGATVRKVTLYETAYTASRDQLIERLVKQIRPETRIVAVTWVHSGTGLKLPIADMARAIAQINRNRDEKDRALLCVDGVHALGVEDFKVHEVGCDFLIAGTHKWMFGPRGTGLVWGHPRAWPIANAIIPTFNTEAYDQWMQLYPPKPLPQPVYLTPGGFHSFEHRWALDEAFAFHEAIGRQRVTERIAELSRQLKQGLAAMKHIILHTPLSQELSAGIVCFEVAGLTPRQAVEKLRQRGIVGSVTPYATQYARLAAGVFNTPEEIDRTLARVQELSA
ncbi:aminotransferase class V-fold PLP-dependent enzyme [Nitrospira moscoviensis]|uniref:Selenocysteine lyase n=1 Tax=Nitrospira moscoviensis TaxID=42253 RepID=A0A0K2G6U2_NITMO|nr:aminotransferase class V-fold PLP-dependent enzyme [Nitrospira moscoviensis]ALA56668.1 Selenocysteine lyase [Nitrospira moscoviensis]